MATSAFIEYAGGDGEVGSRFSLLSREGFSVQSEKGPGRDFELPRVCIHVPMFELSIGRSLLIGRTGTGDMGRIKERLDGET